jgi:hypothetical protein
LSFREKYQKGKKKRGECQEMKIEEISRANNRRQFTIIGKRGEKEKADL